MLRTVGSRALSNHVSQTLDTYAYHFEPQVLQTTWSKVDVKKTPPKVPNSVPLVIRAFLRSFGFFEHFGLPGSEVWTSSSPSLSGYPSQRPNPAR